VLAWCEEKQIRIQHRENTEVWGSVLFVLENIGRMRNCYVLVCCILWWKISQLWMVHRKIVDVWGSVFVCFRESKVAAIWEWPTWNLHCPALCISYLWHAKQIIEKNYPPKFFGKLDRCIIGCNVNWLSNRLKHLARHFFYSFHVKTRLEQTSR
jgi:hypothetical protein